MIFEIHSDLTYSCARTHERNETISRLVSAPQPPIHPVIHGCWGNFILQPSLSADNSFATTDCVTSRSCHIPMHMYIYIYIYIYMHIPMHANAYRCIPMHLHAYRCIPMHMHASRCIPLHMHTYIPMHTDAYACIPIHMYEHAYRFMMHVHAYPMLCMQTYRFIPMQPCMQYR